MAKFELPIYGVDDEIIANYTANHVSWGTYIKAADMEQEIKDKTAREQLEMAGELLKEVFQGLTDEHLMKADGLDVIHTFEQIVTGGQKIKGGKGKNA